ncbi:hypothetical protein ACHAXA_008578 [Cyclostephanos tholiformis]|uniref:Myb-like domain-containing protein n=1 Tax=Cyclostephanos tholiformis TaxID=382380 RepID=A0ABD3R8K4_9STRA
MGEGDDNEDISIHKVHDDTIVAPTSKYADGTELNTTRAKRKNPTSKSLSVASFAERADCFHRAWSERSAVLSIKRSFDILSKIDLSVDRDSHESIEYNSGWSIYHREWSEEEKDVLVAFAKKNIILGWREKNGQREKDKDRAKKGRMTL